MGRTKSPWQREWERNERHKGARELMLVFLIGVACYLAWNTHRGAAIEPEHQVKQTDMRGAAKYQAQTWLKGGRDAD